MFDGLGRSKQPGIKSGHALVFVHNFFAFVEYPHDSVAGLAPGGLTDHCEHLPKTLNLSIRLSFMLFEGGAQLV